MAQVPRRRPSQEVRESTRYRRELRAVGLRIRQLREAVDWTQERAAEKMNLDVTHLNKIERGVVNITFGTIVRIAEGLHVEIGSLFPLRRSTR